MPDMNKKLCVGCTIGPIFATLNKARTPLEIWMASYLFSRVAEEMVGRLAAAPRVRMISPSSEGCKIAREARGVGLYSDHIFFEIKDTADAAEAERLIADAKRAALLALAEDAVLSTGEDAQPADWADQLDREIFVLSAVRCQDREQPIPMSQLTDELDLLECYPPYVDVSSAQEPDLLEKYLISMATRRSAWVHDQQVYRSDFEALMRPADADDPDSDRLDSYVALVQADGDNVGRLLGRLSAAGKVELIGKISDFLFKCGRENADFVRTFDAMPIFFGGDDMLFLAPVRSQAGSVFALVGQLQARFEAGYQALLDKEPELQALAAGMDKPSLSFGVMLCYGKYPLKLIRETAKSALSDTAKKVEWTRVNGAERSKRAVCITLRKHSGQTSQICLKTASTGESGAYQHLLTMLDSRMSQLSLHALHWKIMEQPAVVAYLLMDADRASRADRLMAWMQENFNESAPDRSALEPICDFLCAIADDLWDGSGVPLEKEKAQSEIIRNMDGAFRLFEMTGEREGEQQ